MTSSKATLPLHRFPSTPGPVCGWTPHQRGTSTNLYFQSVTQADYSRHSGYQRKRYIGLDKQSDLRSSLPLADSQGTPFRARSEKQDQYLTYNIVYRHT